MQCVRSSVAACTIGSILLVCGAIHLAGTSIVVIRTPDQVTLAADSKATYRGTAGPVSVCKIWKSSKYYFAVAGLVHDTRRKYDTEEIVGAALERSGSFQQGISRVETVVQRALDQELRHMRSEDAETFAFTLRESNYVVSIVIATVDHGVPRLAMRGFKFDPMTNGLSLERITCPGDCPHGVYVGWMGKASAIEEKMRGPAPLQGKPSDVAIGLVQLQAAVDQSSVGPPIEVLELTKHGTYWVQNELRCLPEVGDFH